MKCRRIWKSPNGTDQELVLAADYATHVVSQASSALFKQVANLFQDLNDIQNRPTLDRGLCCCEQCDRTLAMVHLNKQGKRSRYVWVLPITYDANKLRERSLICTAQLTMGDAAKELRESRSPADCLRC